MNKQTSNKEKTDKNDTQQDKVSNSKKNQDDKNKLKNIFNFCLDFLRSNETLVGDRAFKSLSYLIYLRLLEPLFGKEIDIDGFDYKFKPPVGQEHLQEKLNQRMLYLSRFSNLLNEDEDDLPKKW